MKQLKMIFGLYAVLATLLLTHAAMANESSQRKPCPPGQECIAEQKQVREERRKKMLEERCHGDSACEAQMKQKFEEKRQKIRQAMEQCGQDENCRKETRQKMIQEFKEKRKEHQQKIRENPKK